MSPKKATQKSAESATANDTKYEGFTDEERGAMKQRAQELKSAARRGFILTIATIGAAWARASPRFSEGCLGT